MIYNYQMCVLTMNQSKVILVKLGGSLITFKQDEKRINDYLSIVDQFRGGTATLEDLTTTISHLLNTSTLHEIFRTLNIFIKSMFIFSHRFFIGRPFTSTNMGINYLNNNIGSFRKISNFVILYSW